MLIVRAGVKVSARFALRERPGKLLNSLPCAL
jgi:hypothetical protein